MAFPTKAKGHTYVQSGQPSEAVSGDTWLDTSITPPQEKMYDGKTRTWGLWQGKVIYDQPGTAFAGELWAWGYGTGGQNGNGSISLSSPTQVGSTGDNWYQTVSRGGASFNLKSDGTLWGWGSNNQGQLGLSNTTSYNSPVQIGSSSNWLTISTGNTFTLGVMTDGTLWGWGANDQYQHGDNGTITAKSSPTQIGTSMGWISAKACRGTPATTYHVLALNNTQILMAWGKNSKGQLGDGTTIDRSSPVQCGTFAGWSDYDCASGLSFGIKSDGTLWGWGYNYSGALGDATGVSKSTPTQIGLQTWWSKVCAGPSYGLGLDVSGNLWAWGYNGKGQLGDNTSTNKTSPVMVSSGTTWLTMSTGNNASYAIRNDGALFAWGQGTLGQLGTGDTLNRSIPTQIGVMTSWKSVYNGGSGILATKQYQAPPPPYSGIQGVLWVTGMTAQGERGSNSVGGNISSPVQIGSSTTWIDQMTGGNEWFAAIKSDSTLWTWGYPGNGCLGQGNVIGYSSPTQVGNTMDWAKLGGSYYDVLAIKTDGTLWVWGQNNSGQLGDGTTTNKSSPIQIGTSNTWSFVGNNPVGQSNNLAIKTDGSLWTMGLNGSGQLGDGSAQSKSSPVQVGGSWSVTAFDSNASTCGIKNDGSLWTWGDNSEGQCGQGVITTTAYSSPVQVGVITTWKDVKGLGRGFVALRTDGTLWSWGSNGTYNNGSLGQGDTLYRSSPTQIGTLTTWNTIYPGSRSVRAKQTDGTIWGWGYNTNGQLGNGTSISYSSPVQVGTMSDTYHSYNGYGGSLFLKPQQYTNGNVLFTFGYNSYGQLGDNTTTSKSSPTQIGSFAKLSAGAYSVLGVTPSGTLFGWGRNETGQLGLGDTIDRSSPVQIGTDTTWSFVNLTGNLTATPQAHAIKTDGTLWAWGYNSYGALGLNNSIYYSSPVQIGGTWSKVSGYRSVFGIKTNGTLWAWGYNTAGQLATGDSVHRSSPTQIGALTTWSDLATNEGVFGLKTDGTLWVWGGNGIGQLGLNDTSSRTTPVQLAGTWAKIAHGDGQQMLAIKTDGTLWAWGRNNVYGYGVIGDGTTIDRSSPVQIGTDTTWSQVARSFTSSYATKTDGTLWTWGTNEQGALGLGDTISRSSPTQVGVVTNWTNVTAGYYFGLAQQSSPNYGYIFSVGNNGSGQTGDNTTIERSSPVQIGSSLWTCVGGTNYKNTTCAIKTDGTLWAWGINTAGSGFNDTGSRSSPTQLGTSANWYQVDGGFNHVLLVKTDGTLWGWGGTNAGQLGDGTTINKSSPVQIGTLTNWKTVCSMNYSSAAIKTDGTLWAWGYNLNGQLGQNDVIYRSSPTQVGTLTTWKSVTFATGQNMIAVKTDGTLWAWGYNIQGQLGQNDTIKRSSPTQVGSLTTWKSVAKGGYCWFGIQTDGTMWTCGQDYYGILGLNASGPSKSSPTQIGTLTTWNKVIGGYNGAAWATKTDGTLWAWGHQGNYLGLNDTVYRSSPTQVGSLTKWVSVYSTGYTPTMFGLLAP